MARPWSHTPIIGVLYYVFRALRKEPVLTIAAFVAAASCLVVPPSVAYVEYLDFRVLALLLCLMLCVSGLMKAGVFTKLSQTLLQGEHSLCFLAGILVFLPFFVSMLVTNDVALIIFVPFAILVLSLAKRLDVLAYVVVLQTIAANLGSMVTPFGNPQNLYLFTHYGLSLIDFARCLMPYALMTVVLLLLCLLKIDTNPVSLTLKRRSRTEEPDYSASRSWSDERDGEDPAAEVVVGQTDAAGASAGDGQAGVAGASAGDGQADAASVVMPVEAVEGEAAARADAVASVVAEPAAVEVEGAASGSATVVAEGADARLDRQSAVFFGLLFLISLLAVIRLLPFAAALVMVCGAVLLYDRTAFKQVDWGLLATFVCFFVFVGNIGQIHAVRSLLESWTSSSAFLVSLAASQVISNVPSAVLLAPFTSDWRGILLGVDLGGLGTPIASLASLISLRFYLQVRGARIGRYLALFTLLNVAFLVAACAMVAILS